MRGPELVVVFLPLVWSFALGAQEVTAPAVNVPYQQMGDLSVATEGYFVQVEGKTYRVPTPATPDQSVRAVRQVDTVFTPTPVECGKYYLRLMPGWGYTCERIGYFPWLVAGEDEYGQWRTEIVGNLSSKVEGAVNFQVHTRGMDGKNKRVWGGNPAIQVVMSLIATGHVPGRFTTFVAVDDAECTQTTPTQCYRKPGLVTGSVMVTLWGTSEEVLDAFTTQLTFLYTKKDGTIPWQVAVPVTWWADATNTWTVPVVETPVEVKGVSLPPNNSSFAVVNLCEKPQTIRASLHAWEGTELWARNLPKELEGGEVLWQVPDCLWSGGVYANTLSSVFGDDLKPGLVYTGQRVSEEQPFRGILRLQGSEEGCKIAVLGLRATGDSITSTIAHPEE